MNRYEWATELAQSKVLHQISTQLINEEKAEDLYQKIVDSASTIARSDFASLQMYWPKRGLAGELQLLSFRGFNPDAAKFWQWVTVDSATPCGEALRRRTRIIVSDAEHCEFMTGTEDLSMLLEAGIHSMQTTPLISRGGSLMGMLSTHWRVPHQPSERELRFLDILARQASDLIERRRAQDDLQTQVCEWRAEAGRAQDSVRSLSMRLMKAQDDERRRVARELHDSAGQMVLAIGWALEQAERNASDASTLSRLLGEAHALLNQLGNEIRTTSYLLHPPLLDECGLASAIRWYVDGLMKRSGLAITVEVFEDPGRLPADLETTVFRVVQECLTNVHRHSGSKSARIFIARSPDGVSLRIEDDGRGIPPEVLNQRDTAQTGVGLAGMRERVRHLNGAMQIESSPRGTKVLIGFPLAAEQRAIGMANFG